MNDYNYVISIAGNTTIHFDTNTKLASTKGIYQFSETSRFKTADDAERHAQSLIDMLKDNPAVSAQELQYVTSRNWSIIEFSHNLCVNCKKNRVHNVMNRCTGCSYM